MNILKLQLRINAVLLNYQTKVKNINYWSRVPVFNVGMINEKTGPWSPQTQLT